jgi:hypothetical protein
VPAQVPDIAAEAVELRSSGAQAGNVTAIEALLDTAAEALEDTAVDELAGDCK